jgi:hypothetical protein
MSLNYYIADELANKVTHLSKALKKAQDTISLLEAQNQCLKDVLVKLASVHNEDYEDVPVNSGIEQ